MTHTQTSREHTALVLGATGNIGGEIARQLSGTLWQVRALTRHSADATALQSGIAWVQGDAMNEDDVRRAAEGCSVIVHAVNPPGYRHWQALALPMLAHTLAAAAAERATVVLPGNIYNFGPDAFPLLHEGAPQHPRTRKGAVRAQMEQRLQEACAQGRVRAIVLRAGDYFGPQAAHSWFAQGLVRPGKVARTIWQPGTPGVGHAWAYVPDVAQTLVRLLARRQHLSAFAPLHLAGHWDADGTQMAQHIARALQRHGVTPRVRRFPWWLVRAGAPFASLPRELLEMRHLWREPLRLDNTRLRAVLGEEAHTPWSVAVQATLASLGCLPHSPTAPHPTAATR